MKRLPNFKYTICGSKYCARCGKLALLLIISNNSKNAELWIDCHECNESSWITTVIKDKKCIYHT